MAVPMANDPPFAMLNHSESDSGIPNESADVRFGINAAAAAILGPVRICDRDCVLRLITALAIFSEATRLPSSAQQVAVAG